MTCRYTAAIRQTSTRSHAWTYEPSPTPITASHEPAETSLPKGVGAQYNTQRSATAEQTCPPKRKKLGAPGLRWIPGTPPTAARHVDTQHRRTASPKRNSSAKRVVMDRRRPTNTPHATSYGLDWPFTRKPREKK